MKIETKIAHFSSPLYLESGRILEPYEIAYETYGELNTDKSNVILVCHALSGSHHAAVLRDESALHQLSQHSFSYLPLNFCQEQ